MTKILRAFITSASIMWFSSALFVEQAQAAELGCSEVAKALLSKATGLPTSEAGWIIAVLTPNTNLAPPSVDQRTQTNPKYAKINETDLRAHDKDLQKAQQWMQSEMPLTPDNQNIINGMQKERDSIQKELTQRDLEHIQADESPNEFFAGVRKNQSDAKAHPQHYDNSRWTSGGGPPPHTSPGNTGGGSEPGQTGGGGCGPGVDCRMHKD
ncbi:hypothetical protein [Bradyrhizobium sp. DASA03120]|uniref:hypothetical protein n=1 Tax=Bradyrhizobium sp. SMVTL-02 TaxID=3395917 RepID=UPI003F6FDDF2